MASGIYPVVGPVQVIRDTKANILALTLSASAIGVATDTGEVFVWDKVEWTTTEGGSVNVTESGTSKLLSSSDANALIRFTNAGSVSVTVQDDATGGFSGSEEIGIRLASASGDITLVEGGGVTINASDLTITDEHKTIGLKRVGANTWDRIG